MALSKKISSIYIREGDSAVSPWIYTFVAHNFDSDLGQVNYTGSAFDEAIDGSLRTNIRGFRMNVSLRWQALISSTVSGNASASGNTVGTFLDDMIESLATNGDSSIEVSFDNTNWHKVVPSSSTYGTAYTNQIGVGNFNIELVGQEILTSIPSSLEAP